MTLRPANAPPRNYDTTPPPAAPKLRRAEPASGGLTRAELRAIVIEQLG